MEFYPKYWQNIIREIQKIVEEYVVTRIYFKQRKLGHTPLLFVLGQMLFVYVNDDLQMLKYAITNICLVALKHTQFVIKGRRCYI